MTRKRIFFIGITVLILLFLLPLLHNIFPLIRVWANARHDQDILREAFKQANFQNALILLSLMILSSAIPGVSSSVFCIFVGLLYGPLLAIPMNIIGNTFGNLTSFEILRRLEKPEKSKRMEKVLTYIESFKHRFIGISLAFSIPFIPSALVNYACIQMKLPSKTRVLATLIGVAPISIVYAVSGDLLLNSRPIRIPLVAILALLLFISLVIYVIHFRKEKNELHSSN